MPTSSLRLCANSNAIGSYLGISPFPRRLLSSLVAKFATRSITLVSLRGPNRFGGGHLKRPGRSPILTSNFHWADRSGRPRRGSLATINNYCPAHWLHPGRSSPRFSLQFRLRLVSSFNPLDVHLACAQYSPSLPNDFSAKSVVNRRKIDYKILRNEYSPPPRWQTKILPPKVSPFSGGIPKNQRRPGRHLRNR